MAATPDQIRAKLLEQMNKGKRGGGPTGGGTGGDNASYPFWNIPENSSALIRLLPDGDPDNTFFWQKREVIKLPFQGVVGGEYPSEREVTVTVPCADMFGLTCPIIAETRPWWKDPAKEDLARKYYKKKSYLFQGFVVQSPLDEQNVPENPIRRFVINQSIYEIIEKSLMSTDMDDLPIDYIGGRDFKIAKTKKGDYANYSTSTWSFKTRSLTETELATIDQYGLFNLKDFLGRKPDGDELEAIKEMFHASLAGEPYDMDSFGKYFRPYGSRDEEGSSNTGSAGSYRKPAAARSSEASAPAASTASSAPAQESVASAAPAKSSAQDILDRIKNRTNKG